MKYDRSAVTDGEPNAYTHEDKHAYPDRIVREQPQVEEQDGYLGQVKRCQRVWCRVTKRLDCYQRSGLVYAMSVTSLISAFLSFVIASPFIFLRRFPPLIGSTALLSVFLPIGA
jgi:hypothetical protein